MLWYTISHHIFTQHYFDLSFYLTHLHKTALPFTSHIPHTFTQHCSDSPFYLTNFYLFTSEMFTKPLWFTIILDTHIKTALIFHFTSDVHTKLLWFVILPHTLTQNYWFTILPQIFYLRIYTKRSDLLFCHRRNIKPPWFAILPQTFT